MCFIQVIHLNRMVEIINRIAIKSIVNVSFIVKEKSTKHISQSLC